MPNDEGQAAATEDETRLEQLLRERDGLRTELESLRAELESQLRTQADELDALLEERRLLQKELAVKDEYIASLQEIGGRVVAVPTVAPSRRYRVASAINNLVAGSLRRLSRVQSSRSSRNG
jgi:DNA repair exonuclease SbcCD ATPase subunit